MDINRWKFILFEWIKSTDLIDASGSLEHIDLEKFYAKFSHQISHDQSYKKKNVGEFLKAHFPSYEVLFSDTNSISPQDHVYIFSIFLYHSCVQKSNVYFQKSCKNLDSKHQISIARFFGFIKASTEKDKHETITKELLRQAIKEACPMLASHHLNFTTVGSPLRTPKVNKSHSTPNKEMYNEKMKELKHVKAQLENERYEKNMLEIEVKQNHEKAESLAQKCKQLTHEVQTLKTDLLVERESENFSPNRKQREAQIRTKMQKEISSREDKIADLKFEIENLTSLNDKFQNKIYVMEREMNEMRMKISSLDVSIDDMQGMMEVKNEKILQLEEANRELLEIIKEGRNVNEKDASLDFSYYASHTLGLNASEGGECIANGVVDLQLKEKETENHILNEKIKSLEKKIDENFGELQKLQSEKGKKLTEIEFLGEELRALQIKNQEIQSQFEAEKKMCVKFSAENTKLRHGIESSQILIENLQKDIRKMYAESENEKQEIRAAKYAQKESAEMLKAEKLKSEEYLCKIECLSAEIDKLKDESSQKVKVMREKLLKLEEANKTSHETIKSLSDDKLLLQTSHKVDLMKLKENHGKEIGQVIASKDKIMMKMEESLKGKLRESEIFYKSMEESLQSKTNRADRKIEELQKSIDAQDSKINGLESLVDKISHEKTELMSTLQEKKEEIKIIKCENDAKFKEMAEKNLNLQKEVDEVSEKVQEVLKELNLKEKKILELDSETNALKIELHHANEERVNLSEKLGEINSNLKKTQALLEETQEKLACTEVNLMKVETVLIETQEKLTSAEETLTASNDKYSSEIKQLTTELKLNSSELSALTNSKIYYELEHSKLLEINNSLQTDISKSHSELSHLRNVISEKELIIDNIEFEKTFTLESKEILVRQKAICDNEIQELKTQISTKDRKISEYETEMEKITKKIECLEKLIENHKSQIKDVNSQVEKQKMEVERLQKIKIENEILIDAQNLNIDDLRDEKFKAETDLSKKIIEVEDLNEKIVNLRNDLSHKDTQIVENEEKILKISTELKGNEETLSETKSSFEKLQTRFNTLKEKFDIDQEHNVTEIIGLKSENSELNKKIENLTNESNQEKSELLDKLSIEIKKLQKTKNEVDEFRSKLEEQVLISNDHKAIIEELKSTINIQNTTIDDLKSQIAILQQQKISAELGIAKFKAKVSLLYGKINEISKNVKIWQSENGSMIIELNKAVKIAFEKIKEKDVLKEKLQKVQAEFYACEEKLQQSAQKLETFVDSMKNYEQKYKVLESKLENSEGNLKAVQGELESTKENMKVVQGNLEDSEGKLKLSQKEIENLLEKLKSTEEELKTSVDKLKMCERNLVTSQEQLKVSLEKVTHIELNVTNLTQKLKDSHESAQEKLKCSEVEVKNVNENLTKSEKELKNLQKNLIKSEETSKNLQENVEQLKEKSMKYEAEFTELTSEHSNMINENSLLKYRNSELLEETNKLKSILESEKSANGNEKQTLESGPLHLRNLTTVLTKKIDNLKEIIKDMDQKISTFDSKYIKVIGQNESLAKVIENLERNLMEMTEKNDEASNDMKAFNEDMNYKLNEKEAEVKELKLQLIEYQNQKEFLKNHVNDLESHMTSKEKSLIELESQLKLSKEAVSSLKCQVSEKDDKCIDLQSKLEEIEFQFQESVSQMEELKLQIGKNESQLTDNKIQHSEMKSQIEQILQEKEFQDMEYLSQIEELKIQFEEKKMQFEDSQRQVENSKRELFDMKQKLDVKMAQLSNAACQLVEKDSKLEEMSIQIKNFGVHSAESNEKLQNVLAIVESTSQENCHLKSEVETLTSEKLKLSQELADATSKVIELTTIKSEQNFKIDNLNSQINQMTSKNSELLHQIIEKNTKLEEKESKILEMLHQIDELKVTFRGQIECLEVQLEAHKEQNLNENSKIQELLKKLKDHSALEQRLMELEALHAREKVFNDKMNEDQKILAAKLMKSRKDLEDGQKLWSDDKEKMMQGIKEEKAKFEEGKKEVRLEMEGKLEKMKEKMKSLYSEEMTKKTQKYEEKIQELRTEHQFLIRKNDAYEAQIDRLTKQILILKDMKHKYDEANRENELIRSKLRFMEKNGGMSMSGSIGMTRMPSTTPRLNIAGTQMEDEAGEEFNNTYLKDLKFGSDFSLDKPVNDVCSASVMQQRNSMYPKHMRDSYAVINLDRNVGEEEMRYGSVNLDDSEALLLQNQQRKKQSTSYKRPGPPTPSKNAGRLSIGAGSDVQYTNILKESGNLDIVGKKQTPGRVMAFLSHFSKNKDEKTTSIVSKKNQKHLKINNVACIIDGDSSSSRKDSLSGSLFTKELNRMERRNDARDNNRHLDFDDIVVDDCEENDWTKELDSSQERKIEAKAFTNLNDSFKQKKITKLFVESSNK